MRDEPYKPIVLDVPAVERMHHCFLESAAELDMRQIAVPIRRRVKAAESTDHESNKGRSVAIPIPEHIFTNIGFVAAVPRYFSPRLPDRMGYTYDHSFGVDWRYYEGGSLSRPFFDGHMGLCLSEGEVPFAACSGSLTADGPLIMQIQGLAKKQHGQEIPQGFDWKLTLVEGIIAVWQKIIASMPEMAGRPTAIMDADYSKFVTSPENTVFGLKMAGEPAVKLPNGRIITKPETYKRVKASCDYTVKALGSVAVDRFGNHILPSKYDMPKLETSN